MVTAGQARMEIAVAGISMGLQHVCAEQVLGYAWCAREGWKALRGQNDYQNCFRGNFHARCAFASFACLGSEGFGSLGFFPAMTFFHRGFAVWTPGCQRGNHAAAVFGFDSQIEPLSLADFERVFSTVSCGYSLELEPRFNGLLRARRRLTEMTTNAPLRSEMRPAVQLLDLRAAADRQCMYGLQLIATPRFAGEEFVAAPCCCSAPTRKSRTD